MSVKKIYVVLGAVLFLVCFSIYAAWPRSDKHFQDYVRENIDSIPYVGDLYMAVYTYATDDTTITIREPLSPPSVSDPDYMLNERAIAVIRRRLENDEIPVPVDFNEHVQVVQFIRDTIYLPDAIKP